MSLTWLFTNETTLPETWAIATLDEVAEVSPSVEADDLGAADLVHFVPMAAASEDFRGINVAQLRPFGEVRKGFTAFAAGDVLLAKITPCMENGKGGLVPALPQQVGYGSTEFHVLRAAIDGGGPWLAQFLSQPAFRKFARANMTGTAGQMRVPTKWLRTLGIPVPPRAEQTRIVAKLEELLSDLDAGVAELKAAQKKLAQYRQSLLKAAVEGALTAGWRAQNPPTETGAQLLARILTERRARWEANQLAKFKEQGKTPPKDWQKKYPEPVPPDTTDLPALPGGWGWASIEQVASDERYSLAIGPFGSNLTVPDYRDSGVPLIFVRNIRSGLFGSAYTKCVTEEKALELSAHSVSSGDVLVTKMGEPPGDAAVYPDGQPQAIITADCIKIRCQKGLMLPHFLKAIVNSYVGRRQIGPITQGVAQKKVSLGRFTGIAVPVPPLAEQQEIESQLAAIEAEADVQLRAIEFVMKQSTAQRQNILRAAFAGQLVPQNPADEPASVLLARIRAERTAQAAVKKPRGRKAKEDTHA